MSNLAELSKSDLAHRFERMRSKMAVVKKEGKQIAARTISAGLSAAGGYGVGYARKKWGDSNGELNFPGTDIDADLVVGTALTLVGVSGLLDEYSEHVCSLGNGVLAGALALNAFKSTTAEKA